MNSRLRKLKAANKGLKLSDGKTLSGQNRLSSSEIEQLQTYYENTIGKNTSSVIDMKQAIWTIYYHKFSSDDDPKHGLCPRGESSWCKYQQSLITKTPCTHKNSIPRPILKFIKPVFESLSESELLERCLHGRPRIQMRASTTLFGRDYRKQGLWALKFFPLGYKGQ